MNTISVPRRMFGLALSLLFSLSALCGLLVVMRPPTARAQDMCAIGNVVIYADTFVDPQGGNNFCDGGPFFSGGNVKIGLAGQPPLLRVDDVPGQADSVNAGIGMDGQPFIMGAVSFISDTNGPLVTTSRAGSGLEELTIDGANGLILLSPELLTGVVRNSTLNLNFLDRSGLRLMYRTNTLTATEPTVFVFDLANKRFVGTPRIDLRLDDNDENTALNVTVNVVFQPIGTFTGTVANFEMTLGGLLVDVLNITLLPGEFAAQKVQISKADNPDLPLLDVSNQTVIFEFEQLRYKDGKFSIAGGSVPLRDLQFSDSFSLINNRIGLYHDDANHSAFFTISSTLQMGNVMEADPTTNIPVTLKIGAVISRDVTGTVTNIKPLFGATLANFNTKIGPLGVKLEGISLVGNTAENFFGLKAAIAKIQWPSNLGGQTGAGIVGFKLGINKTKDLVFSLGGATVSTPPLQSSVLQGSALTGTVGVFSNTVAITFTGNLNVRLSGGSAVNPTLQMIVRGGKNVQSTCAAGNASCLKRFEASLTAFSIKMAGFGVTLTAPRFRADGGFEAQSAVLSLPSGLGNLTAGISGLQIAGNGQVTITGGQFEIPPLTIGGTNFVGLKGGFSTVTVNGQTGYKFIGGAKIALPGLEPGNGNSGISAQVTVETTPTTGSLKKLAVVVSFSAHPGIPLGGIPAQLVGLTGSFSLETGTATFGVAVVLESNAKLPLPPPANLPLVTLNGNSTLQINPFRMTLGAQLKLLVFNVASGAVEIGHQAGFSGGKGVHITFNVDAILLHGNADIRLGKVNNVAKFRGTANLNIGIEKRQFGTGKPPFDINLLGIAFQVGEFEVDPGNAHTVGLMGSFTIATFDFSVFVDLNKPKTLGSGFVKLVDADNYTLLNPEQIAAAIRAQKPGFASRLLSFVEAEQAGFSPTAAVEELTIPYFVTYTAPTMFGINYTDTQVATPTVMLVTPDGMTLTMASPEFMLDASPLITKGNDLLFILSSPVTGTYSLIVQNEPTFYELYFYMENLPPRFGRIINASCGGLTVTGVTMACNGVTAGSQVTLTWSVLDVDSPETSVTLSYGPSFTNTQVLTEGLPKGPGGFVWDVSEVPSGTYSIFVEAFDSVHQSVVAKFPITVVVTDTRAPAVPTGLTATALAGQLGVVWTPNTEQDLGGYEIGFGVISDTAMFSYTRDMGAKDLVFTGTNTIDAKLWGLEDDQPIFYSIRAYDLSGNYSVWSPMVTGQPWAFSPRAWSPAPGETTGVPMVDVAFLKSIMTTTLTSDSLTIRNAQNGLVPGTLTYLYDLDGTAVVGLHFQPDALLPNGVYTATLAGGLTSEDNKTMPADFVWTFTVQNAQLYLPLLMR